MGREFEVIDCQILYSDFTQSLLNGIDFTQFLLNKTVGFYRIS